MSRRLGIAFVLLLAPSLGQAQEAPERLLSSTTQVYVRWDGFESHRGAYEKTALGKMLQGDTGKFLAGVTNQLKDDLGPLLTVQQLLGGLSPDRLQKMLADANEAPKLLDALGQHGLVVGVEVRGLEPPAGQVTMVLPNGGGEQSPLFGTLRLAAVLSQVAPKELKVGTRTVHHVQAGPVSLAWWSEGKDGVVVLGTDPPEAVLKRLDAQNGRLPDNPLFQKVQAFRGFETALRGFVNVAAVNQIAQVHGNREVGRLITNLGLDSIRDLTLYSGFDGEAERGLLEMNIPGPRKGLLGLASSKPFRLANLPPLPPDCNSFAATRFSLEALYDTGLEVAETAARIFAPTEVTAVKKAVQQAEAALGIKFREDLLAPLGDLLVQYDSPAEGPLSFGQTFLYRVKDATKLQETVDKVLKALATLTGTDIRVSKKTYRGVELREVHVRQQGFIFVPTYTIHNGWLVLSYYPQAVQGYVLRATGELPAWKPGPNVAAALDKLPPEFLSVSVADPRPTLKQLLALAPLVASAVKSFLPGTKFDVGSLPNAHEATRHLFPNVSIVSSTGDTLRMETRASLMLPFELNGLDSYALVAGIVVPYIAARTADRVDGSLLPGKP
jgi:hypothetical protein